MINFLFTIAMFCVGIAERAKMTLNPEPYTKKRSNAGPNPRAPFLSGAARGLGIMPYRTMPGDQAPSEDSRRKAAAAKSYIENMYKMQSQNHRERRER